MAWVRHHDKYPQPAAPAEAPPLRAAAAALEGSCCHGERH